MIHTSYIKHASYLPCPFTMGCRDRRWSRAEQLGKKAGAGHNRVSRVVTGDAVQKDVPVQRCYLLVLAWM